MGMYEHLNDDVRKAENKSNTFTDAWKKSGDDSYGMKLKTCECKVDVLISFFFDRYMYTHRWSQHKKVNPGRHYVKCESWKLRLVCCLNWVRGSSLERRNRNEQPTSFSSSHLKRQGMLVHHLHGLFRNLVMLE